MNLEPYLWPFFLLYDRVCPLSISTAILFCEKRRIHCGVLQAPLYYQFHPKPYLMIVITYNHRETIILYP